MSCNSAAAGDGTVPPDDPQVDRREGRKAECLAEIAYPGRTRCRMRIVMPRPNRRAAQTPGRLGGLP